MLALTDAPPRLQRTGHLVQHQPRLPLGRGALVLYSRQRRTLLQKAACPGKPPSRGNLYSIFLQRSPSNSMAFRGGDFLLHLLTVLAVVVLVNAATTTPATDQAVTTAVEPKPEAEVVPEQYEGRDPITCYVCNSFFDGDACLDPMDEGKRSSLSQVECNATIGQFACFKVKTTTYQYATSARPETTTVVTSRLCGNDDDKEGEDTWWEDSGSGSGVETARCTSNLCNSGDRLATSNLICLASTILGACAILGLAI